MRHRDTTRRCAILAVLVVAVAVALSTFIHYRADFSDGRLYTVSPYTKSIVRGLQSELLITWYRSGDLARMTPAVNYIQDFIEEYRLCSDGTVSFLIKDPARVANTDAMESLGVVPRQTSVREKGGTALRNYYSGLVIEYRGEYRTIPFLLDTKTLEYDLTRMILELETATDTQTKPSNLVQYIHAIDPNGADYRYLEAWIAYAGFKLERVTLPAVSLDTGTRLLVVGTRGIDPKSAAAIDRFLTNGGSAVFFVSGNEVKTATDWNAKSKIEEPLLATLSSHGFSVVPGIVMDALRYRITLPSLNNERYATVDYPFWVTVPNAALARDEPVLSGITRLQFYWPSGIILEKGKSPSIRAIAHATSRARIMLPPYDTNPFGNQDRLLELDAERGAGTSRASNIAIAAAKSEGGRVIVVADEYMPSKLVDYTGSDGNLDFAVSALEWISGRDGLLSLKARRAPDESRDETDITEGSQEGEGGVRGALDRARIVNLVAIPSCVLLAFIIVLVRRRRTR